MARLRIATFNLLHGRSLVDGTTDEALLHAAARCLDADILGLQEVDRRVDRSGGIDQAAVLAEVLGAAHVLFVPTLSESPGVAGGWTPARDEDPPRGSGLYGIALVSRYPLREVSVRRFPAAPVGLPLLVAGKRVLSRVPDEPRAALAATADTPYGPITVVTAHLSFVPGWNVCQLRAIAAWVRHRGEPRLLLGDLNIPAALLRSVSPWQQLAQLATYPAPRPTVQFDHILGSGVGRESVSAAAAIRLPISDHCALAVDLERRVAGPGVLPQPYDDVVARRRLQLAIGARTLDRRRPRHPRPRDQQELRKPSP